VRVVVKLGLPGWIFKGGTVFYERVLSLLQCALLMLIGVLETCN